MKKLSSARHNCSVGKQNHAEQVLRTECLQSVRECTNNLYTPQLFASLQLKNDFYFD